MIDSSANLETETRCRSTPKAHLALLPKVLHLGFLVTVKGGEWRFRFTVLPCINGLFVSGVFKNGGNSTCPSVDIFWRKQIRFTSFKLEAA